MPKVVIENVPPYDGTYELLLVFTHRDYGDIKRIAGIRANEAMEAVEAGDVDMLVALAAIALRRAGITPDVDLLFDAPVGTVELVMDEEDVEVVETPTTSANGTQNSGFEGASGTGTKTDTDSSLEMSTLGSSGTPPQASTSGQET